jgi:predicted XRE-type DNA-binding protein|tara:strand:- start:8383 stop:8637 length:255 start_codon:yes stop_codon:yes gene_type:complete
MPNATLTTHHVSTLRREPVNSNRVGKAIELAGVTQRTIARAIDVPESYVSDLVRQRYDGITVRNAHKVAQFFGCAIEVLFPRGE